MRKTVAYGNGWGTHLTTNGRATNGPTHPPPVDVDMKPVRNLLVLLAFIAIGACSVYPHAQKSAPYAGTSLHNIQLPEQHSFYKCSTGLHTGLNGPRILRLGGRPTCCRSMELLDSRLAYKLNCRPSYAR